MMKNDTLRGVFFITKGRYVKGIGPTFVNEVTKDTLYLGGFDPDREETENWYMAIDRMTMHCVCCGSDLKKVLEGVYNTIYKFKGSAKKYFKHISDTTSDDYYEVHYLGRTPLDSDKRAKKAEGRCPRVSPAMKCLYTAVCNEYGHYYDDEIEEVEERAYEDLEEWKKQNKPFNKTMKRLSKTPIKKKGVLKKVDKKEEDKRPAMKRGVRFKPKHKHL